MIAILAAVIELLRWIFSLCIVAAVCGIGLDEYIRITRERWPDEVYGKKEKKGKTA